MRIIYVWHEKVTKREFFAKKLRPSVFGQEININGFISILQSNEAERDVVYFHAALLSSAHLSLTPLFPFNIQSHQKELNHLQEL